MAKELPYFRFTAHEWLNDDISLESYALKGAFIDVCAYYWSQDCNVTLAKLKKRFSNASVLLDAMIQIDVIKHENRHDKVEIVFLNKQYDLLSEKRKLRQSAGSKGGNAKAKLKQKPSYKDKDNNKDNDKENTSIVFPYVSEDFKMAWTQWKDYKLKEFRFKYKSAASEQAGLNQLKQLAGLESVAINIIAQSMANGWKGFFPIKDDIKKSKIDDTAGNNAAQSLIKQIDESINP